MRCLGVSVINATIGTGELFYWSTIKTRGEFLIRSLDSILCLCLLCFKRKKL